MVVFRLKLRFSWKALVFLLLAFVLSCLRELFSFYCVKITQFSIFNARSVFALFSPIKIICLIGTQDIMKGSASLKMQNELCERKTTHRQFKWNDSRKSTISTDERARIVSLHFVNRPFVRWGFHFPVPHVTIWCSWIVSFFFSCWNAKSIAKPHHPASFLLSHVKYFNINKLHFLDSMSQLSFIIAETWHTPSPSTHSSRSKRNKIHIFNGVFFWIFHRNLLLLNAVYGAGVMMEKN